MDQGVARDDDVNSHRDRVARMMDWLNNNIPVGASISSGEHIKHAIINDVHHRTRRHLGCE